MHTPVLFVSRIVVAALFAGLLLQLGCPDGGANHNRRGVGDEPGGVRVGLGDIAVAPTGDYVVFGGGGDLTIGQVDSGDVHTLPVKHPSRVAFAHRSDVLYVGSTHDDAVHAVDLGERAVLWSAPVRTAATKSLRLAASTNDTRLVVASETEVSVLDVVTGEAIQTHNFEQGVVDVQVHPDNRRALIVEAHIWEEETPQTRVSVLNLKTGERKALTVPNCADAIAITPDGEHALMAPTTCTKDPISLIDLENGQERFVRNLPGFGPVAIAPGGETAVGFLDAHNVDETLFDDPEQIPPASEDAPRYYLMVIHTKSFEYTFHALGQKLPRYALTDDGAVVLVDFTFETERGRTRIFDLETASMREIQGPHVQLDNFVLTSDSRHAYGLQLETSSEELPRPDQTLFHIDIDASVAAWIAAPFVPTNVNISSDDRHLFLRRDPSSVCVFDLAQGQCARYLGEPMDEEAYRTTAGF